MLASGSRRFLVVNHSWPGREGYTDVLRDLKTTTAFAMTLSTVALPLVSGLALLLGRPWAGRTVLFTCVVILIVNFMVLRQVGGRG
jgi:hypothetical protein